MPKEEAKVAATTDAMGVIQKVKTLGAKVGTVQGKMSELLNDCNLAADKITKVDVGDVEAHFTDVNLKELDGKSEKLIGGLCDIEAIADDLMAKLRLFLKTPIKVVPSRARAIMHGDASKTP